MVVFIHHHAAVTRLFPLRGGNLPAVHKKFGIRMKPLAGNARRTIAPIGRGPGMSANPERHRLRLGGINPGLRVISVVFVGISTHLCAIEQRRKIAVMLENDGGPRVIVSGPLIGDAVNLVGIPHLPCLVVLLRSEFLFRLTAVGNRPQQFPGNIRLPYVIKLLIHEKTVPDGEHAVLVIRKPLQQRIPLHGQIGKILHIFVLVGVSQHLLMGIIPQRFGNERHAGVNGRLKNLVARIRNFQVRERTQHHAQSFRIPKRACPAEIHGHGRFKRIKVVQVSLQGINILRSVGRPCATVLAAGP